MNPALESLLQAALLAPSGDNTQPWRFRVDGRGRRIDILLDPARDPSPMNAGQRMARVALGAAGESLLYRARSMGWSAKESCAESGGCFRVECGGSPPANPGGCDTLKKRATNRRPYDGRPLPARVLAELRESSPPLGSVRTHWISQRERRDEIARLVGKADAILFGEQAFRDAFLGNIRFDQPPTAAVEEGLSVGSLELTPLDRRMLPLAGKIPQPLFRVLALEANFARHARRLVRSASGLAIVIAPDELPTTDVAVGRAMLRAWLAATRAGLAVQPMMSFPVLDGALSMGESALQARLRRRRAPELLEELRRAVPEVERGRVGWLMRVGYAPPPTCRTGRRPLQDLLVAAGGLAQADGDRPTSDEESSSVEIDLRSEDSSREFAVASGRE